MLSFLVLNFVFMNCSVLDSVQELMIYGPLSLQNVVKM